MNLEDLTLSEINRSQEDQYCVMPIAQGFQRSQIRRQNVDSGCQGLAGWGRGMAPYLTVCQGQNFRLVIQKVLKMGGGDDDCV